MISICLDKMLTGFHGSFEGWLRQCLKSTGHESNDAAATPF